MSAAQNKARLTLRVDIEKWPLKAPFRITGHTFVNLDIVVVSLSRDGHVGRGEASGVYYFGDTPQSMAKQIEAVRPQIEAGIGRDGLQQLLPAGGARNAVDCALWDLEARLAGVPAWKLAGLNAPTPIVTTFTLGANEPGNMAAAAAALTAARAIKLKLTGEQLDSQRVLQVRGARPDVWLAVDANQGFTPDSLAALMPTLVEARVELIEQPFPRGRESDLDGLRSPIPLAADESVQDRSEIAGLVGRFDMVNIKLDKSGGLTEALAMAPAFLIGQLCRVVDLDGATFLKSDRTPGTVYEDGTVWCPPEAWGGAEQ